ncbi:NAD(P)-dependent alcohol dehydrogenase [Staphylococcus lloydii]|uniref:NAD(P)-dependent alcohol dehydrogenase n=1 Tax=Staphylococcus lloydii TaxID=2781774 RepID=UPI00292816A8|nr:NAD(P)-dependent alcohol dehydrogenase [Staphylococcus lloydii]MDU9418725.1 NAD(P)-dependent alcohol dehydrogenase [Staphylococcus lloydii]
MINAKARAVNSSDSDFYATEITRRDLDKHDILIEIKYAGICHSDIHIAHGEWGPINYPLVPGHEIAGIVKEVGSDVSKYQVDDRVGVGCMVDSCGECEHCQNGEEQYCSKGMVGTYASTDRYGEPTQGGYSTHIVVHEDFVLRIPDNISLDAAAPLLCAGITTYSPLNHWKAYEGKNVAVIGMGGLGHMAVQIAHAMGAKVTVLSRTLNKKEDGLKLGAAHYYATSDDTTFEQLANSFDLIINTVSANLKLDDYLKLLSLDGTIVNVGAPAEPISLHVASLIGRRRSFAGSAIGGIRETQEMLDFCSKHNIKPQIELISADQIDEAYERVLSSDVKYRFVIDTSTM